MVPLLQLCIAWNESCLFIFAVITFCHCSSVYHLFGFHVDKLRHQPSPSPDNVDMRNGRRGTPEKRSNPHSRYSFHIGETPSKLPVSKRQGKHSYIHIYLCWEYHTTISCFTFFCRCYIKLLISLYKFMQSSKSPFCQRVSSVIDSKWSVF